MSQEHKKVLITHKDLKAEIDEEIAPLILSLWQTGIKTLKSCQDNQPKGWIWIEFAETEDATNFMEMVAGEYSDNVDSLYNRVRCAFETEKLHAWKYNLRPCDLSIEQVFKDDYVEEEQISHTEFTFTISIRFPFYDLLEVTELIKICIIK